MVGNALACRTSGHDNHIAAFLPHIIRHGSRRVHTHKPLHGTKKLRGGSPHCRRRLPSESYGFVRNVNTFAYFPKPHRHIFHRQRGSGKYGGGTLHSACGLSVWRWIAVHICQRAQGNSLRKTYGALRISGILRNKPAVGIFHGLYPQARNYRHLGGVSIRAFGGGFAVLAQIPTRTEEMEAGANAA